MPTPYHFPRHCQYISLRKNLKHRLGITLVIELVKKNEDFTIYDVSISTDRTLSCLIRNSTETEKRNIVRLGIPEGLYPYKYGMDFA